MSKYYQKKPKFKIINFINYLISVYILFFLSFNSDLWADEATAKTPHGETKIVYNKVEGQLALAGKLGKFNMYKEVKTEIFKAEVKKTVKDPKGGPGMKLYFKNLKFSPKRFVIQFGVNTVITLIHKEHSELKNCAWTQEYRSKDSFNKPNKWTQWVGDPVNVGKHPNHQISDRPSQDVDLGLQYKPMGNIQQPTALIITPRFSKAILIKSMKKFYSKKKRIIEYEFKTIFKCNGKIIGYWTWGYINTYDGKGKHVVTVKPKTPVWTSK